MCKLLSTNAKLEKSAGIAADYLITGLTMAPHGLGGHNVCGSATPGCMSACNACFSGQRVPPGARAKALAIKEWFINDRPAFLAQLHKEIKAHIRKAAKFKLRPLVRLNVASDL